MSCVRSFTKTCLTQRRFRHSQQIPRNFDTTVERKLIIILQIQEVLLKVASEKDSTDMFSIVPVDTHVPRRVSQVAREKEGFWSKAFQPKEKRCATSVEPTRSDSVKLSEPEPNARTGTSSRSSRRSLTKSTSRGSISSSRNCGGTTIGNSVVHCSDSTVDSLILILILRNFTTSSSPSLN